MNHKFYSMLALAFLFSSAPALGKSVVQKCVEALAPAATIAPRPLPPERSAYYLGYAGALARDPAHLPPTRPFDNDAAPADLKSSFYFWWYPENAYGRLMVPRNEEFAGRLIAGEAIPARLIPTAEELRAEAEYRERHPILVETAAEKTPAAPGPAKSAAPDPATDPLDTSPTKDAPNAQSAAEPTPAAAPVGHDPGPSFTDAGPPPSTSTDP